MQLPYITSEMPGIGGKLRAHPDHFIVDEIPLYEPGGEGQHLYVNITKVGLTTKEVQKKLARLYSLREADIGFAGMKDKYARTTQTFSLSIGHKDQQFVEDAASRIAENLPVTVNWTALHKNKLRPGHLLGNRFRILITEVTMQTDEAIAGARSIADLLIAKGMPNYFGPQRFGVDDANVDRGLNVLLRKQYVKDRWLRRFLVSAYQSHLCNKYMAMRVDQALFDRLVRGDVAKKYATGGLFDVIDLDAEAPRFANQEISHTAPLFGTKMRPASQEAGELEMKVLEESPITLDDLRKAKVEGTRRLGRLLVPDLTIEPAPSAKLDVESGAVAVTFSLPKGSFATTVLREIMKTDLAHIPDE